VVWSEHRRHSTSQSILYCVINKNLLIAVEGLSGSGKTTVANLLAQQMAGSYYKTPAPIFEPIRTIIDRKASAFARHLYYYAGIAQASAEISVILDQHPVVCDKYLATMIAYSRAAGVTVETPPLGLILEPDFTFLLDVPEEVRLSRLAARGHISKTHAEFLSMERRLRVLEEYKRLAILIIDNSAPAPAFAVEQISSYLHRRDKQS
jgi:dTMP kinase